MTSRSSTPTTRLVLVLFTLLAIAGCRSAGSGASPGHKVSLTGTWVGQMPGSQNGAVLDEPEGKEGIFVALLEIQAPGDASGPLSGTFTLCDGHVTADTETFSQASLGKGAVPLTSPSIPQQSTLSLVDVSSPADAIHAVFLTGGDKFAGYLHRQDSAAFHRRCQPASGFRK